MGAHSEGDERDRLAWEFALLGQSAFNWVLSGSALLAAAELAHGRFLAALGLQGELFRRDSAGGLTAIARRLTQEEVDLLRDVQLGPVAIMLLGFAIENWAKGLMVHTDPTLVRAGDGIAQSLKEHRLERLVRACDEIADAEEERALRRISRYTIWAGRYPIPTKPSTPPSSSNSVTLPGEVSMDRLWDRAQPVVTRLRDRIHKEFPNAAV